MAGTTTNTPSTVAIFNSSGLLDADTAVSNSELQWLDGASGTTTVTLVNNQTSNADIISYASSYNGAIMDYVVSRGTGNRRCGKIWVTTDATSITHTDDAAGVLGTVGVTFNAIISGSNVIIQYTSTNTGTAPSIKYQLRTI